MRYGKGWLALIQSEREVHLTKLIIILALVLLLLWCSTLGMPGC
jgi:hypothetical protein